MDSAIKALIENTQGKTLEEARENLREAIELVLLSSRELVEKARKICKDLEVPPPKWVLLALCKHEK